MAALKEFLKTTIIGGLMFLVPVILIVVILGHAMRLAAKVAVPIAERFATTQVAGVAVVTIVAALVLIKRLGVGSAKALGTVDLTPVPES